MNTINKLWVDKKWISYISIRLERFKWVDRTVANFRCPLCGDSQKSKSKARGYFFEYDGAYVFKCHNACGSMSFESFLKENFPADHKEYKLDLFREMVSSGEIEDRPKKDRENSRAEAAKTSDPSARLSTSQESFATPLNDLEPAHPALEYVTERKIPTRGRACMYYTDKFRDAVLSIYNSPRYKKLPPDKRILIPLRDRKGNIKALQGRRISAGKTPKYITVKFDESFPKIFGLDRIDPSVPIIVVEGPIDSMFLPNCVAVCGGDVESSIKYLRNTFGQQAKLIVALDNEPRHRDTIKRMSAAIRTGVDVAFWPRWLSKDVNDMILKDRMSSKELLDIISNNMQNGIAAKARLSHWSKTRVKS